MALYANIEAGTGTPAHLTAIGCAVRYGAVQAIIGRKMDVF